MFLYNLHRLFVDVLWLLKSHEGNQSVKLSRFYLITKGTMLNNSLNYLCKRVPSVCFRGRNQVCFETAQRLPAAKAELPHKHTHRLKQGAWLTRMVGEESKICFNPVFIFISQKVQQNDCHSQKKKASTIKSQVSNPLCLVLEPEPKEIVF